MSASPSDRELAALPVAYGTAMGMPERSRLSGGETVLVTGASGGVGLALVRLAAARGARVAALTGASKAAALREAGAAAVLFREADPAELRRRPEEAAPEGWTPSRPVPQQPRAPPATADRAGPGRPRETGGVN